VILPFFRGGRRGGKKGKASLCGRKNELNHSTPEKGEKGERPLLIFARKKGRKKKGRGKKRSFSSASGRGRSNGGPARWWRGEVEGRKTLFYYSWRRGGKEGKERRCFSRYRRGKIRLVA